MYTAAEDLYVKNGRVSGARDKEGKLKSEDERGDLFLVTGASISDEEAKAYGLIEVDKSLAPKVSSTQPKGKAAHDVVETRATAESPDMA